MSDGNHFTGMDRRAFLKGLALGTAGVGLSSGLGHVLMPAQAQDSMTMIGSFYRFNVGDFQLMVVQDRTGTIGPANLAVNASADELAAVLEANNLPNADLKSTFNVILLEGGERRILFDTGNGAGAGVLAETLAALGVPADSVTDVLISHLHPDHVNGISSEAGIAFPNAVFYIGETENGWLESGEVANATAKIQPVIDAGMLNVMPDSGEWLPGITAMPAFGHTPGHLAFMISSGSDTLLTIVDAANNNIVSLARPEWALGFDSDPDTAGVTRRALLDQAAADKTKVFGYHFAFPGVGYVVADGDGFRFNSINA